MHKLYIKVSNDEYELLEAVADDINELANETNKKPCDIRKSISKDKRGFKSVYKEILIEEEQYESL